MNANVFFDSHCHFDFSDFDLDREAVWAHCKTLGIQQLVIPGVEPAQWEQSAQVSAHMQGIYYAIGLHPWWIEKNTDFIKSDISIFERNLSHPSCVAIGECGLDGTLALPLVDQLPYLALHLEAASELNYPLIIHCRKAHNELILALKRYSLPAGGVIHGFSGSLELAKTYWALGFRLGVGGVITYTRAHKTREVLKSMPLEALLLETDAPDMPLSGRQGQRNSPEYIRDVAIALAELRDVSVPLIAAQTTQNARDLFKKTRVQ